MSESGRIPDSFIESVLAKTDIVSLIQESLKLKKNGANYSACCPFHSEKTPSFTVSPHKQFYHCFGCGAHGDAIRFVMEYQALSFVEAVERLASRLGLTVPKDAKDIARNQLKNTITSVLNRAAEFYSTQLKRHPEAEKAVGYLKKRGLTGVTAKKFGLGFAPAGWANLLNHFSKEPEALKILEETGLIIKHPQGRYYDRFRERVMFPIRDRRGEVIAFGARVLDQSQPKYLNSPESAIFQKGHCLYGIYEALKAREKWQAAIVVEGYMDVVALAQHQVVGALATLGTAITSQHLSIVFQLTTEIVFCFDGDKAGKGAAWKALQLTLPLLTENRQVKFAFLPQGEDPDSYVRQYGTAAFHALVKNSTPLSEYFFATLCQETPPNSLDNSARLASHARPLLEQIPAGIFKEMMYEQLARLTVSSTFAVRGERARHPYVPMRGKKLPKAAPAPTPLEPAYMASALLLSLPELYQGVREKLNLWQGTKAPGIELLFNLLDLLKSEAYDPMLLREKLRERGFELKRLAECENKIALLPVEGLEAEFWGSIQRLVVIGREQQSQKLLEKAKKMELTEEEKQQLKDFLQARESI